MFNLNSNSDWTLMYLLFIDSFFLKKKDAYSENSHQGLRKHLLPHRSSEDVHGSKNNNCFDPKESLKKIK